MQLEKLRQICQGEKLRANTGATLWNRKVSIHITKYLIRLGVTANQATWGSIILGLVGSFLFLPGKAWLNVIGAGILYLSLLLDQVDGELARYYKSVNLSGVYLDEIRHLLIYAVTIFCISCPLYQQFEYLYPHLVGFVGATLTVVARVEQRLPLLIYSDRVILRNNFTGGNFVIHSTADGDLYSDKPFLHGFCFTKKLSMIIYSIYHMYNDQVYIIVFLLTFTILDALCSRFIWFNTLPTLFLQMLFLYHFTFTTILVLSRTIYSHWRDGWVELECAKVYGIHRKKNDFMA